MNVFICLRSLTIFLPGNISEDATLKGTSGQSWLLSHTILYGHWKAYKMLIDHLFWLHWSL